MDSLIAKKFAGIEDLRDLPLIVPQDQGFTGNRLKLSDAKFNKGDVALAFDILLGDALFVDRMSYNFVTPKVGTLRYSEQHLLMIIIENLALR